MNWTEEQLDSAWNNARVAPNRDKNKYRLDAVGAMMYRESRDNTDMAWEMDHIFPYEILEYYGVPEDVINRSENLRVMHHSNNSSKGISFPTYTSRVKWDDKLGKNVKEKGTFTVKATKISILRDLFEPYLGMTLEEAVQVYEVEHLVLKN